MVALITEQYLTPRAQAGVTALIGVTSLADISTYLDSVRADRPETRPWHYVSIPRNAERYDRERDCQDGECIVEKVDDSWAQLADPAAIRHRRAEALKVLVHLIGDLHQPLHVSGDNRGQNTILINFFGRETNIHAVWDTDILERTGKSERELASSLIDKLKFRDIEVLQRGAPLDWAMEAHHAADEHAYLLPPVKDQGQAYYLANRPVLEEQLLRAGARLAKALNLAFAGMGPPATAEPQTKPEVIASPSPTQDTPIPTDKSGESTPAQPLVRPTLTLLSGVLLLLSGTGLILAARRMKRSRAEASSRVVEIPAPEDEPASRPAPVAADAGSPAAESPNELGRLLKVFLCHSTSDKSVVRDLYRRLLADGFDPWLDEEKLLGGQTWELEIPKAVKESDVVIICLSRNSINKKGYVQKELRFALDVADEQPEGTIYLIPLRLEECELPVRLQKWHCVDYFQEGGYDRLGEALKSRASRITS